MFGNAIMSARRASVLLGTMLVAATATAQQSGSFPLPQPEEFRLTIVSRTTAAVNYRPREGETRIDFVGTALLPGSRGSAG